MARDRLRGNVKWLWSGHSFTILKYSTSTAPSEIRVGNSCWNTAGHPVISHKFFAISSPRTAFPTHQIPCLSDHLRLFFLSRLSHRWVSELFSRNCCGPRGASPITYYFAPRCPSNTFACTLTIFLIHIELLHRPFNLIVYFLY
jgi:hypothetical protein